MLYTCDCIVHVYDGIQTTVMKPTYQIDADNEDDAKLKIRQNVEASYRSRTDFSLSGILIEVRKE